jgi:hypothetical protein
MFRCVNLALMEAENARRAADRAGRPALHPLAEYYGDWERTRDAFSHAPAEPVFTVSLVAED